MRDILTIDEAVATIKRSSLPTVITEGREDYLVFRRIEEDLIDLGVDIIAVGGKDNVLELFDRRREFGRNDIVFFVDRDSWIFSNTPLNYNHYKLLITNGYSIENDIYIDGGPEALLTYRESIKFSLELDEVMKWYCFAITERMKGNDIPIKVHPNQILSMGMLCNKYCLSIGYVAPNSKSVTALRANYQTHFRGKNLLELIVRQLSEKSRWPKYSKHQIIDISASKRGPLYTSIKDSIEAVFKMIHAKNPQANA